MSLLEKQKMEVVAAVLEEMQSFSFTDKKFDLSSIIEDKGDKIIEVNSENISEVFAKAFEDKGDPTLLKSDNKFYLNEKANDSLFRVMRASRNQICREIREEITSNYSVKIVPRC